MAAFYYSYLNTSNVTVNPCRYDHLLLMARNLNTSNVTVNQVYIVIEELSFLFKYI